MSEAETMTPPEHIQQSIRESVADYGCAVLHDSDPAVPERHISLSVGFESNAGQPEVVIYGLADDLARSMINEVFRQCKEEGLELTDGQVVGNLIEGYDCMIRRIDNPHAYRTHFGLAAWYLHETEERRLDRAVQIVWPDPKSRCYPWQDECADDVILWQTALYPLGAPK